MADNPEIPTGAPTALSDDVQTIESSVSSAEKVSVSRYPWTVRLEFTDSKNAAKHVHNMLTTVDLNEEPVLHNERDGNTGTPLIELTYDNES